MIFLWNAERVLAEIFELARLKIAGLTKVPEDKITASVQLEGGNIKPSFQIEELATTDLTNDQVQAVIGEVWGELKPELIVRLKSLYGGRRGC